ncbi:hypothetical protein FC89_GL000298 [Liquorilactobacillus ghanensis DSM 18630]|uniref:Uncharacterized protein n=1 Tax=Liquorilactobacillus ghanensis DSM 18630 TaxID=1423750 RepID=A0A0R1VNN7_9LACO|nr:hypothetical protein [Liquorilactobacillus ghanensis]KRM06989.1 hypothetical protein FC89_GL000298 [Liquorilactobacillus ghanensis DSM 18630]
MKKTVITIGVIVVVGLMSLGWCSYWFLSHTATGIRTVKNFQSETNNGIERDITVYNADGKAIMHFKGKFDVSHQNRSLQYVDQHNRKHNIYFGDNTTVIVNELK